MIQPEQHKEMIMRIETQCSYCGVKSHNQPPGDGCHSCLKGIMKPIKDGLSVSGLAPTRALPVMERYYTNSTKESVYGQIKFYFK